MSPVSMNVKGRELEELRRLLVKLIGYNTTVPACLKKEHTGTVDLKEGLSYLLDYCETRKTEQEQQDKRITEILDVVISLANLDYSKKAKVIGAGDYMDALAAGINMLGEELNESTISLHEKETLLKEIHHRIKNNLQLVSSLLNIQSSFIADKAIAARLRESQDRIKSIALLHEKLYETKDLKKINFTEYITTLTHTICETYLDKKKNITCEVKAQVKDPYFSMDMALPCGLILNELLTNAVKYAFRKTRTGKITISLKQDKKKYMLKISDNGSGIPAKVDLQTTKTLGLQLVATLAEQLKAELKLERKKGTTFTLRF
jgi:two-component sensor histidine kinase